MDTPIPKGFTISTRIDGIVNTMGKAAGLEQNWGYNAFNEKGDKCILLYCNPGDFTIIDNESLEKIRKVNEKQVSWFIGKNGYVGCRTIMGGKDTVLTLHQHLMNHYGHGRGKESIDHINRNKLDNRLANLRITTQSIQNENRDKVKRQKTAKELPDEIKDVKLPKFIVYYREKMGENRFREFFTVEGHPIQKEKEKSITNNQTNQLKARRWATTKSNSISITSKLEYAKSYLSELDKLKENPSYIMKDIDKQIIISNKKELTLNEIVLPKPEPPQEIKQILYPPPPQPVQPQLPKQWKAKQIWEYHQASNLTPYKAYCEVNNNLGQDWEQIWGNFVADLRAVSTKEAADPIIKSFIEYLRAQRHNVLVEKHNHVQNPLDRDDRKQWPSVSVLRAFKEGQMELFKTFQENYTGDCPDDSGWLKLWEDFVEKLQDGADEDKIKVIRSFMQAQRTRVYRHKIVN